MFFKCFSFLEISAACTTVSVYAAVCNDRQVVESTSVVTGSGNTLKMQTYTCSNTVHSSLGPAKSSEMRNKSALEKRDSRCTSTGPCLCGVACIFDDCRAETQFIRQTDCATIISSLQTNSGTFTIQVGDAIGFIFESCEYTLFATQGTQYCFSDMGNAAANVFAVCGAGQQGACKMTSGSLTAFVDQISL